MRLSELKRNRDVAQYLDSHFVADRCRRDGSPLNVQVYADQRTRISYQVDESSGLYREADFSRGVGTYGEWKKFDPE